MTCDQPIQRRLRCLGTAGLPGGIVLGLALIAGVILGLPTDGFSQGAISLSSGTTNSWVTCYGNMFEVEAINPISVHRISFVGYNGTTRLVEVWKRPGGHNNGVVDQNWEKVGEVTMYSTHFTQGEVPLDIDQIIMPGEKYGFATITPVSGGSLAASSPPPPPVSDANVELNTVGYRLTNYLAAATPTFSATNLRWFIGTIWYDPVATIDSPDPGPLTEATEGQTSWSETFEASGTAPFSWSLSGAPGWLSFSPTTGATVSLTASTVGAAGAYAFDVTVTDGNGLTATESYTLDVQAPPVISGPAALDPVTEGGNWPTPQMFSSSGGVGPFTWTMTGAPPGVAMTPSGADASLDGPLDPGTAGGSPYSLTLTIEDANGVSDTLSGIIATVNPVPIVLSGVLSMATLNIPYSELLQASDGTPPYTWSATGTMGPFSVDPGTGEVTGIPLTVATYSFDVTATDQSGVTATGTVSIDTGEYPEITPPDLPELTIGAATPADTRIVATKGFPQDYTWSHIGALPSGLSLADETLPSGDVAYALSGTPDLGTAGSYPIEVTVLDTFQGLSATLAVTVVVNVPPSIDFVDGTPLPGATITGAYGFLYALVPDTGTAPFVWSFENVTGASPTLASFAFTDAELLSSDVDTVAGLYEFTVRVEDANGVSATVDTSLVVNPPPAFDELPYAREGKLYEQPVTLLPDTGTAPFTYTVMTDLPVETTLVISMDLNGVPVVSGTPPKGTEGSHTFVVTVLDANGVSTTATLNLFITKAESTGCCGAQVGDSSTLTLWWLVMGLCLAGSWRLRRR